MKIKILSSRFTFLKKKKRKKKNAGIMMKRPVKIQFLRHNACVPSQQSF